MKNKILELYEVNTIEELKKLIQSKDEKVADLIEFLSYVKEQEREEINETKEYL